MITTLIICIDQQDDDWKLWIEFRNRIRNHHSCMMDSRRSHMMDSHQSHMMENRRRMALELGNIVVVDYFPTTIEDSILLDN
jgi:hypothetical protein